MRSVSTAVRRSSQRQHRLEVRERIIAAAKAALRERPYRELSVEEVMSAAGLTRTIFYRHFDDLADLVVRLLDEASAELYNHERRLAATVNDDPESIRLALSEPVRMFSLHGPVLRAVTEAASHDEQIEAGWGALRDRFAGLIEEYLRSRCGRAIVADPAETARALNLMNMSYLLDVFGTPEPKVSPEVALQTLTEIWVAVILN